MLAPNSPENTVAVSDWKVTPASPATNPWSWATDDDAKTNNNAAAMGSVNKRLVTKASYRASGIGSVWGHRLMALRQQWSQLPVRRIGTARWRDASAVGFGTPAQTTGA